MQKDEVIQLHTFLFHIKMYLEHLNKDNGQDVFTDYDDLGVAPQNIYKSKEDHEHAVFEICNGISTMMQTSFP